MDISSDLIRTETVQTRLDKSELDSAQTRVELELEYNFWALKPEPSSKSTR